MKLAIDARGQIAAFSRGACYPAAHSMDTSWYAVDREGQVAQLWSGEEGSVPIDAHRQYWDELWQDLCWIRALPSMPQERGVILSAESSLSISPDQLPHLWDGVLLFENQDYLVMFRDEYYHAEWVAVEEDVAAHAVKVRDVLDAGFNDYWQAGAITAAIVLPRDRVLPRKVGLYEYQCDFSGPYHRQHVPAAPIRIDELPESLRNKLSGLRVKFRFESTPELNPEQLGKCFHYGR